MRLVECYVLLSHWIHLHLPAVIIRPGVHTTLIGSHTACIYIFIDQGRLLYLLVLPLCQIWFVVISLMHFVCHSLCVFCVRVDSTATTRCIHCWRRRGVQGFYVCVCTISKRGGAGPEQFVDFRWHKHKIKNNDIPRKVWRGFAGTKNDATIFNNETKRLALYIFI